MHQLLPLFLRLEGRRVVLVGAGRVAEGKLPPLLEAGAEVTVVAPETLPRIARSPVTLVRREFAPSDLDGAWLAVSAAPPAVNREVVAAADVRRIFVNAVDDPASASAFAGGVVRRGGATVAVSTSGVAPALAGLLREALEAVLPEELERWTELARGLRRDWREQGVRMERRRPLLLEALNRLYDGRSPADRAP
jgi:uroporphyrin-III C-methyltransferase/precorrin-2 dehydrogenase/sirohydrochlorin ferrochelatase